MPLKITSFGELLVAVRASKLMTYLRYVPYEECMVVIESDGHWSNPNGFVMCWLSYKVPDAALAWFIYTNSLFEFLLGLLKLSHLKFWEGFTAAPELPG